MTIKELIEELMTYPEDATVILPYAEIARVIVYDKESNTVEIRYMD